MAFSRMRLALCLSLLLNSVYKTSTNGYLLALVYADLEQHREGISGPVGRFGQSIMAEIQSEVASAGQNWLPLKAGLFGGSDERFLTLKTAFDEWVRKVRRPW
jgi:hypothetical protein